MLNLILASPPTASKMAAKRNNMAFGNMAILRDPRDVGNT